MVAFLALLAAVYLLFRRRNVFMREKGQENMMTIESPRGPVCLSHRIRSSLRLRCWLLDNYADLERKEVWQSLVFAMALFAIYIIYTSNAGELTREYLSQVISIVIIAFFVWRVETLQELPSEEEMKAF